MASNRTSLRTASKAAAVVAIIAVLLAGIGLEVTTVHGSGTGGTGGGGNPGPCSPVVFVAATGSGEYPRGNDLSVSPGLNYVYQQMLAVTRSKGLPDKDLKLQVLPYSAVSFDVLTAGLQSLTWNDPAAITGSILGALLRGAPGAVDGYLEVLAKEARNSLQYAIPLYLDSEREGVSELQSAFDDTRATCPHTRFVLAGYSQGAMVVHDFLNLVAAKYNTHVQSSIIGAVLLADPDRTSNANVIEFGSAAQASEGVCQYASRLRLGSCATTPPLRDVARMFQSRTVSVCTYDDPVCDTSNFIPDLGLSFFQYARRNRYFCASCVAAFFQEGKTIHGSYSSSQPAALAGKLMGRFIVASLL